MTDDKFRNAFFFTLNSASDDASCDLDDAR